MSLCIKVQGHNREATEQRALVLCGALREAGHQAVPWPRPEARYIAVYTTCPTREAYLAATAGRPFVRVGSEVSVST